MVLGKTFRIKIYGIIGAFITLLVPFFLLLVNQDKSIETAQSLCPLKMLTGFPCAGCGITKSMIFFYQGDLQRSLYYHILGPVLILFCVAIIVLLSVELIFKKELLAKLPFKTSKVGYGLIVFLTIFYFLRIVYFVKNNSIDEILHQSIWK